MAMSMEILSKISEIEVDLSHYGLFGVFDHVLLEIKNENDIDENEFTTLFQKSIPRWRQQGKKLVSLKLSHERANLIEAAMKEGFYYPYKGCSLLIYRIPKTNDTLPQIASYGNASSMVNAKTEVSAAQKINGVFKGKEVWESPSGTVEKINTKLMGPSAFWQTWDDLPTKTNFGVLDGSKSVFLSSSRVSKMPTSGIIKAQIHRDFPKTYGFEMARNALQTRSTSTIVMYMGNSTRLQGNEVDRGDPLNTLYDAHGGIHVTIEDNMDEHVFTSLLQILISQWRQQGKTQVVLKLCSKLQNIRTAASRLGFVYRSDDPTHSVFTYALQQSASYTINTTLEVPVVHEENGVLSEFWDCKSPSTFEEGEGSSAAAIRKVTEDFGQNGNNNLSKPNFVLPDIPKPTALDFEKLALDIDAQVKMLELKVNELQAQGEDRAQREREEERNRRDEAAERERLRLSRLEESMSAVIPELVRYLPRPPPIPTWLRVFILILNVFLAWYLQR